MAKRQGFTGLLITEIFHSIQGEGTHVGLPYVFVRLTGCNLRCHYCDTSYAFKGGQKLSLNEALSQIQQYNCPRVLITGGEPLLQRQTIPLIQKLLDADFEISLETHGEVSLQNVPHQVRIIMDIKTPDSGAHRGRFEDNFEFLKPSDEIKFVLNSWEDYRWAREWVRSKKLPQVQETLFSSANLATGSPGHSSGPPIKELAEKILSDQLPVRLQTQLHKLIWGANQVGV